MEVKTLLNVLEGMISEDFDPKKKKRLANKIKNGKIVRIKDLAKKVGIWNLKNI